MDLRSAPPPPPPSPSGLGSLYTARSQRDVLYAHGTGPWGLNYGPPCCKYVVYNGGRSLGDPSNP